MRDTVVDDSGNFDFLKFYNMHLNLNMGASSSLPPSKCGCHGRILIPPHLACDVIGSDIWTWAVFTYSKNWNIGQNFVLEVNYHDRNSSVVLYTGYQQKEYWSLAALDDKSRPGCKSRRPQISSCCHICHLVHFYWPRGLLQHLWWKVPSLGNFTIWQCFQGLGMHLSVL